MKENKNLRYTGERAEFKASNTSYVGCLFEDGESPLKESTNITVEQCDFKWKYPIWYSENIEVNNTHLFFTARSGIWYTKDIRMLNCVIDAPKTFRYAENVLLEHSELNHADETFWNCKNIKLSDVKAKGDYLGFHSEDIEVDRLYLDGNYAFDSAKNITIRNSILNTKDAFWNVENVTVINSRINGEYLGWNSKDITFINCEIISHQGLCYMENVKLVNCKLIDTDLCFEFCSNIDADIVTSIDSVKNPYSGRIHAYEIKELIMDEKYIDPSKTEIVVDHHE